MMPFACLTLFFFLCFQQYMVKSRRWTWCRRHLKVGNNRVPRGLTMVGIEGPWGISLGSVLTSALASVLSRQDLDTAKTLQTPVRLFTICQHFRLLLV